MAVKSVKQTVEPIAPPKPDLSESVDAAFTAIAPDIDIESMIADQLLDDIDWQKVRAALIRKAPAKLFKWFQSQILPSDGSPMITNEIEAMAICEGKTDD
jgi:hypothetical protein